MNRRGLLLGAAALAACGDAASGPAPAFPMRRAINLGNALEAPNEGEWGYRIAPSDLAAIAQAGFDGVRLPVRWDAHAETTGPYIISPGFFDRIDQVIAWAFESGLKVQVDCHHYEALIAAPERERERFVSIWRQIGEYFSGAPDALLFEPLNEPNGERWRGETLTSVQAEVVAAIRETNATRLIVLGPGDWNAISALMRWTPPEASNIAVSVHYYEPHDFTHQNAEWLGDAAPQYAGSWGSTADLQRVAAHARRAADWAARNGMALQLGEFGVNAAAPLAQRAAWTRSVRLAFESMGAGWCVWDFAGAFPLWDSAEQRFIPEMLDALGL